MDEKELEKLEKEVEELQEQSNREDTAEELKKKLWALKHRKGLKTIDKVRDGFGKFFKGLAKGTKNTIEKMQEMEKKQQEKAKELKKAGKKTQLEQLQDQYKDIDKKLIG